MGWLSMPLASMGGHTTPKAYLDAQFTYTRTRDDDTFRESKVLASSCLNNRTYYAAVQQPDDGVLSDIFAVVCLVRWNPRASDGYVFAYKSMDESMGPCEAECPERTLRALTPTTYEHAIGWRQRCRDNLLLRARPITDGMRIKLPKPVTFTDGYVGDDFIVGSAVPRSACDQPTAMAITVSATSALNPGRPSWRPPCIAPCLQRCPA